MSAQDFANRMRWWCLYGNLGYDQCQRWDIREGGESDCSSLVLFVLWECGYLPEKPTWGNSDTLWAQLKPLGFKRVSAGKNPPAGTIRLRTGHVAVSMGDGTVAQASIDERGKITGGQSGDQTGRETNISKDPCNWTWDIYLPDCPTNSNSGTQTTTQGSKQVYNFGLVKVGAKGDFVKVCQSALNARNGAGLHVDGDCGSKTKAAIRKWQLAHGLDDDGECGKLTWNSLLAD